ncbi:group II intron reverse transcriptase/maturase [Tolypothrix sp. VBCCA 56010]|uniref:group II intron reverse transcriptase/maturase n=1 Tax=Tolypothrix sp. VBCCA 56010 TaxID=3137731 RepID=UPI003D7EA7CC
MSNTESNKATVEWKDISWRKVERIVFKLQKRIYQASQRGDVRAVRRLQKTLMKSWSAKVLAVRRVTQDNQGKKTAGVDGVKSLTPKQRLELVDQLRLNRKAKPTRRVWIPKPGREEKRPLGIPTIHDRATQALAKAALEPEWEAKFEPNSFGFRPGRSCHDAVEQIFQAIKQKAKYVLDADIAKCFDQIDHKALLEKLNTFPTLLRQIKAWLKAGVIDWSRYANRNKSRTVDPNFKGTPQGGVISPLLANIALHGMETVILGAFPKRNAPSVIRYADDFVVLHENLTVVQQSQQIVAEWLKGMGLELKPSKTRISHTLHKYEGNVGFDFLGFNIRQHPVGKYQTGRVTGKPLGFKTIITPSKEKLKAHTDDIGIIIRQNKSASQAELIARINPIIRGWSNYYSSVVSKAFYSKADAITYHQLRTWADHRHPYKSKTWVSKRYWHSIGTRNWVFATRNEEGMQLLCHADTPIKRHVQIQRERSPYDGDWVYWSNRRGNYPGTPRAVAALIKSQNGKCSHCGQYFTSDSLTEVHHKDMNRKNNKKENLTLVHRHCHDVIHGVGKKVLEEGWLDEHPF